MEGAFDAEYDVARAPAAPFALVLGGSTLQPLLPLVTTLLPNVNDILLGGVVANTFLVAAGWQPGGSVYEPALLMQATSLLSAAQARGVNIHWPVDVVVRDGLTALPSSRYDVRPIAHLPANEMVVDVGNATTTAFRDVLARAATALWVGPMGDCSIAETQGGSLRIGQAVGEAARGIVAGKEVVDAVRLLGLDGRLRVAAGADATWALFAGESFPGLDVLRI